MASLAEWYCKHCYQRMDYNYIDVMVNSLRNEAAKSKSEIGREIVRFYSNYVPSKSLDGYIKDFFALAENNVFFQQFEDYHKQKLKECLNAVKNELRSCGAKGYNARETAERVERVFELETNRYVNGVTDYTRAGYHNALLEQAIKDNRNRYVYILSDNHNACARCLDLSGRIISVKDTEPWVNLPPIHPNCGCSISIVDSGGNFVDVCVFGEMDEISLLSLGSKGEEVKKLQARLNELGYTDASGRRLAEDGSFGQRTLEAVNKFKDTNAGRQPWRQQRRCRSHDTGFFG